MSNISDYLLEQQKLTKKNLEILKGINESFYTKSEHITLDVDGKTYTLPSFLSLEAKLNTLQDNFENLVNAPQTGDASFDFNGNTQSIEVKGYANTPDKALPEKGTEGSKANAFMTFDFEDNAIFKDFCTPKPFVKIPLNSIPNDIPFVRIKKIIPKNQELINLLTADMQMGAADEKVSVPIKYSDVVKILYNFSKGSDYEEYDTLYNLPVRRVDGSGKFTIRKIEKNWIDADLDEHYILTIADDKGGLNYYIDDETLKKQLVVGDFLLTNNDKIKLQIEDINTTNNQVVVKVLNGGYADLCSIDSNNPDLYTLKYFGQHSFERYKYVNIPLEEDQFVAVFIAPISRVSLIQAEWGTGVMFNIYNLTCEIDGVTYYYKDYYNTFVKNIGDTLYGLTDLFGDSFVNFTEAKFKALTTAKPELDASQLEVVELNKHLNNSKTVEELYGLYNQKQSLKSDLEETQKSIDEIQSLLNSLSFTDTSQNRTVYEQQLAALKKQKKDITTNITNTIKEISNAANDSETPINDPKYRIRGFFDVESFIKKNNLDVKVCKIEVLYRYKNITKSTGNAITIGEDAIFTDWNLMDSIYSTRQPKWTGVQTNMTYEYPEDNTKVNEISFNQIDIPISQGETVDIKMRVIYANGQPFVTTYSDWSDVINIEFPAELRRNVTVVDIIETNNNDIQSNQFTSLLEKDGVIDHVDDVLVDQNITFFHQPEHIASGFYTEERRVIPLKTKLEELSNNIVSILDEISGTESTNLAVSLVDSTTSTELAPMSNNVHIMQPYSETPASGKTGTDAIDIEHMNIEILNTSSHVVKLFPIIPGSADYTIDEQSHSRYDIHDYVTNDISPLFADDRGGTEARAGRQHCNAWVMFRCKDLLSGQALYQSTDAFITPQLYGGVEPKYNSLISAGVTGTTAAAALYPVTTDLGTSETGTTGASGVIYTDGQWDVCIPSGMSYKEIKPGEAVNIPVIWEGVVSGATGTIDKTISFDLRTSLYKDPINYKVTVKQSNTGKLHETISRAKKLNSNRFNSAIVNTQVVDSLKKYNDATTK